MNLSQSVRTLSGVGDAYGKRLERMGISTIRDLLFHFPREYEDFSEFTPISRVTPGKHLCCCGTILSIAKTTTYRRRMSIVEAILQDGTGAVRIVWFNQPYLADTIREKDRICVAGKVARDKNGAFFSAPSFEKQGEKSLLHVGRIVSVYPETRGVSSKYLRFLVSNALSLLGDRIPDPLPPEIISERNLLPLSQALSRVHFPSSMEEAEKAQARFSFEELFFILLFILSERKKLASVRAPSVPFHSDTMKRFTDALPFTLTDAQKKAAWHILKDMEKPRPMNRLLQGDVGSGKTVVASMAALSAVKAGHQVAFMAPTEILAKQHFKTVASALRPFKVMIGILTGKTDLYLSPKLPNEPIEISRRKLLEKTAKGEIGVLIGTHALIQDKVRFDRLGLLVLDEQHRFGVQQRARLLRRSKDLIPHLLSMTATPIPRTLSLTVYGDLDLTLIDQLPEGRKTVTTRVIPQSRREEAYDLIRKEIGKGRQAFVICPRIDKSEREDGSELKAVKEEFTLLSERVFPDLRLLMLHGKLGSKEKERVMRDFVRGKADIIVSTSVVEVGVDVPNATVMLIEGADRFGLAQLHQFRGRVGRSSHQSHCLLIPETDSPSSRRRLKTMEKTSSGFVLAEEDLKHRGPGDFSGTKQWGMPDFAMRQLTNLKLVEEAREAAHAILDKDRSLARHPLLRERVEEMRKRLHLE